MFAGEATDAYVKTEEAVLEVTDAYVRTEEPGEAEALLYVDWYSHYSTQDRLKVKAALHS